MTIQDPLVTVELSFQSDIAEVRAGVRLGVALTPCVFTRENPRQVILSLLLATHKEQGVAEHLNAEHVVRSSSGNTSDRKLFSEDHLLKSRQSRSAVLLWPTRSQVTRLEESLSPF